MMTGIEALIESGESDRLEFKKSTAERDRACRTLAAFANGQGGRLHFGVSPAGKAVGQAVRDRTLEDLAREFQGFEPPLFPDIRRVPLHDGLEVQVLDLDRPSMRPVSFRGVSYERVLNTTQVMPRASYQRLLVRIAPCFRALGNNGCRELEHRYARPPRNRRYAGGVDSQGAQR